MESRLRSAEGSRSSRRRQVLRWAPDLCVASVLLLGSAAFVASQRNPYEKSWEQDTFYQRYYTTAVMSVCGLGWYEVDATGIPELRDFLGLRSDTFDCAALPETVEKRPPSYQAVRHYYLFRSVALTWKWTGRISWQGLKPLFGVLCGLVSAAAYGLFRLGAGRLIALAGALAFFPLHVVMVPYLRDYAKAPFILLAVWLTGLMLEAPWRPRRLLVLAAAAGANVGVGLGFRSDILIVIPLVVLAIAVFQPGRWREHPRTKAAAIGAFFAALAICGWPHLRLEAKAHSTAHVVLHGFANPFIEGLALKPSLYEWSHVFSDPWVDFQVKSHARYVLGREDEIEVYSQEYDRIGARMLLARAHGYPADLLARAYAAVLRLIQAPVVFAAVLLIYSTLARRQALFLLLATLYLTGYTGTQFHLRHSFHLQIVPLWYLGFAIQGGILLIRRTVIEVRSHGGSGPGRRLAAWWRRWRAHLGLVPAAALLALALPLLALRLYQDARVGALLEAYDSAEVEALATEEIVLDEAATRLVPVDLLRRLPTAPEDHLEVGYLVIDLIGKQCPLESVEVTLRYTPGVYHDFSRTATLTATRAGRSRIVAPIYSRIRSHFGDSPFLGVEVEPAARSCLSLSHMVDLRTFPPIQFVRLPEDWRRETLHHSLTGAPGWSGVMTTLQKSRLRWRKIRQAARPKQPEETALAPIEIVAEPGALS